MTKKLVWAKNSSKGHVEAVNGKTLCGLALRNIGMPCEPFQLCRPCVLGTAQEDRSMRMAAEDDAYEALLLAASSWTDTPGRGSAQILREAAIAYAKAARRAR